MYLILSGFYSGQRICIAFYLIKKTIVQTKMGVGFRGNAVNKQESGQLVRVNLQELTTINFGFLILDHISNEIIGKLEIFFIFLM